MKWKHTPYGEWVSSPFFIRRSEGSYTLYLSDGSGWGKLVVAGLPSLAAVKAAAEEAARELRFPVPGDGEKEAERLRDSRLLPLDSI